MIIILVHSKEVIDLCNVQNDVRKLGTVEFVGERNRAN